MSFACLKQNTPTTGLACHPAEYARTFPQVALYVAMKMRFDLYHEASKGREEVKTQSFLSVDARSNENAKAGDQLGMFGEVANVPGPKPMLDKVGETKGRAVGLFEIDGDPDQILLFDDGVATPDRTWKPEA